MFYSAPLWPNFIPHVETLSHFVTHTLPKPVLIALLYRLAILYLASGILPTIGADDWEPEDPMESDRPVSTAPYCSFPTDSNADVNTGAGVADLSSIHFRYCVLALAPYVQFTYVKLYG